jgi:transcription antitermination factor NusG
MSSRDEAPEISDSELLMEADCGRWYAVHVRARSEKAIEYRLRAKGLTTCLPLAKEVHRWSDRRKVIEVPLFACYVFVRLVMNHANRLKVLDVGGVLSFVGGCGRGTPIPDPQIDAVRTLVSQNVAWSPHPFMAVGERVRIRGGALDGIEGMLLSYDQADTLVLSVEILQRSLTVRIAGYQVEALPNNPQSFEPMRRSSHSSFHELTGDTPPSSQLVA